MPRGFAVNPAASTPANNATKVSVDKAITIQFTEAVDPASVTAATVQLQVDMARMGGMGGMAGMMRMEDSNVEVLEQVPGTATASGNTVTFTPVEHLHNGMNYKVVINGVKAQASTATVTTTIGFSTLRNPMTERIEYSRTSPGVIERRHVYEIDSATGMMKTMTSYDGAGVLRSHEVMMGAQLPGPPPVSVMEVTHTDIAGTTIRDYEAEVAMEGTVMIHGSYAGPGADTLWNKTDDLLSSFTESGPVSTGSDNWLTKRFSATTAPAPWIQRTTAFTWRSSDYTQRDPTTGRTLRQFSYSSADGRGGLGTNGTIDLSPDGSASPIDDTLVQYRVTERDSVKGERTKITRYGSRAGRNGTPPAVDPRGPDGRLFTADDPITEIEAFTYDNTGHETLEVEYDGPGPDNNWATLTDNLVDSYEITTYSGAGIRDSEKTYEPGLNGIMENGGGDDVLVEEKKFNTTL